MSHIIKKQVLMLDIPKGYDSWRVQDNFKAVFNEQVLPRLDAICREMGLDDNVTLKLDKLLIDTGAISARHADKEWVLAIEEQFRQQLKLLKSQKSPTPEQTEFRTREASEMSMLSHFLEKGTFPWWVSDDFQQSPDALMSKLLSEQPARLVAAIRKLRNKAQVAERLVKQFKKATRRKLIDQLTTAKTQEALDWLEAMVSELKLSGEKRIQSDIEVIRIRSLIDNSVGNLDAKALFTLVLERSKQSNNKHHESDIQKIHKTLTNKSLITNNKLLVKDKKLIKSMVLAIENSSGWRQSETDHNNQSPGTTQRSEFKKDNKSKAEEAGTISPEKKDLPVPSGDDIKSNQVDSWSWSDTSDQEQTPDSPSTASPEQKALDSQDKKTESSQTKGASQSQDKKAANDQDKHVWEQIERIKKANQNSLVDQNTPDSESPEPSRDSSSGNDSIAGQKTTGYKAEKRADGIADDHQSETRKKPAGEAIGNDSKSITEDSTKAPSYWPPVTEPVEECYIQNAGLALFWPFLAHFFRHLELMEGSSFKSEYHQERAALTLQFLLSDKPELEEYLLPLNKLLCGLPAEYPLEGTIELNDEEHKHCRELLEAAISNWTALKGTSIPGFQSTFLQRDGVLKKQENGWLLQVERKAFDMLLEQLPWPISIVRLTWMEEPIYVEW